MYNWLLVAGLIFSSPGKYTNVKGGGDLFGYRYLSTQDADTLTFDWIEISGTGTNLNLGDDDSARIYLGFSFPFYDTSATTVLVQSNGGITIDALKLGYSNKPLPYSNAGNLMAVYWSDQNPSSHGGVYYQYLTEGTDTVAVVVEWYQVPEYGSSDYNTYEVIIYRDGRIKYQYLEIARYSDETVGIQSGEADTVNGWYIEYVYGGDPSAHIPADSTAILFYRPPKPDHDIGVLKVFTDRARYGIGDTVFMYAVVRNYGSNPETFDLRFIIDTNGVPVLNTVINGLSLDTSAVDTYTMEYVVDAEGLYNVRAISILSTDTIFDNDTAKSTFLVPPVIKVPYFTNFEADSGCFYHEGSNDPWQWGEAAHVHSGTKAWATILNGPYPPNADGKLISYAFDLSDYSNSDSLALFFWHYDSLETNYDKVYLLVSTDFGTTWDTLATYTGYNDWQQAAINLSSYAGQKVVVAFAMKSDGSVQKAGFFLDDLLLYAPVDSDLAVWGVEAVPQVVNPNDTVVINIAVKNTGLLDQSAGLLAIEIYRNSVEVAADTLSIGNIASGEIKNFEYPFTATDTGSYKVIARTLLPNDGYPSNDTGSAYFVIGYPHVVVEHWHIGGDGIADVGETDVPLILNYKNEGARADSIEVHIRSLNSHVEIVDTVQILGGLNYQGSCEDTVYFNVSSEASAGEEAQIVVNIYADGVQQIDTLNVLIGGKAWTIMVFINADNNLTSYGVSDVDEMESIGSNEYMNIVVQFDGYSSYNDSAGSHTDANRYYITYHPSANNMIDAYPLVNLGEVNMGDTSVAFDFFRWAVENYPARHYMFIIWNHGSGWLKDGKGASYDDTDNDHLSAAAGEIRALLRKMKNYLGRNIDIFAYDVCLNQMVENLYDVIGYANYFVASERSEPGDGWDYHFLEVIANNPNASPKEVADAVVHYYAQYYASHSEVTQSAMKVNSATVYLGGLLTRLAKGLIAAGGIGRSDLQGVISALNGEVENYGPPYTYYVDLYHFVDSVRALNISDEVNEVCDSILYLFSTGAFVDSAWASSDVADIMHGISINVPPNGNSMDGDEAPYSGLLFARNTLWDEFLLGSTALSDTPDVYLHAYNFIVDGMTTDTLTGNLNGELHLYVVNYSNTTANNVSLHLSAPAYLQLDDTIINISELPADTIIEVSIPFSTSPVNAEEGNSIELAVNGKTYQLPFFFVGTSGISQRNKAFHITALKLLAPSISKGNFKLRFAVPMATHVKLAIYDIQGRRVKDLLNQRVKAGYYEVRVDGLRSGIYFIQLATPEKRITRKLMIVR